MRPTVGMSLLLQNVLMFMLDMTRNGRRQLGKAQDLRVGLASSCLYTPVGFHFLGLEKRCIFLQC